MKITITYNNIPFNSRLQPDWGFSAYVEGLSKNILFDTGANGNILLSNMSILGIKPSEVDIIFFSHHHWDHTGGAEAFLKKNPDVTIYLLSSFSDMFKNYNKVICDNPEEIMDGVFSTGKMGTSIEEHSLIVNTDRGYVVITGCSHSNVANIVEKAKEVTGGDIYLIIGGFHMAGFSETALKSVIDRFRNASVEKVAPSHCTGETALQLFREEYKGNYIETGVGSVLEI